jgi:hypothetical protein
MLSRLAMHSASTVAVVPACIMGLCCGGRDGCDERMLSWLVMPWAPTARVVPM